jgi:hypothetical protein
MIGPDAGRQSRVATEQFADLVGGLAMGFVPDFEARGLDPRSIANGLVGSTIYLAMQWVFAGFKERLDDITDHAVLFYDAVSAESFRRTTEGKGKKP